MEVMKEQAATERGNWPWVGAYLVHVSVTEEDSSTQKMVDRLSRDFDHSFLIQDISIVIDICFDLILCEEYISMTWAEDSLKLAPKYQGQKVNLTLIAPVVNTEYKLSRWISNISPPEYKINLMYSYDEQWVISFWESLGMF